MLTQSAVLPMIAWFLFAGITLLGASMAALGLGRRGGSGSLLVVVLGVTGLLILLGDDLACLAWLGAGMMMIRLLGDVARSGCFGSRTDTTLDAGRYPPTWHARMLRRAAGLPAIILGFLLLDLVWTVDWQAAFPFSPAAATALVGGRLLTTDLALWLALGLFLVTVLVVAGWLLLRPGSSRDEEGA
jgi:hypothetical protein